MITIVQHVRHPFNDSRYIGTVAAVVSDDGVWTGFSQCHPNDVFSKKIGRDKAIGRAVSFRRAVNTYGEELVPVPFKSFNPDGSKFDIRPIEEALVVVREKAQRLVPVSG